MRVEDLPKSIQYQAMGAVKLMDYGGKSSFALYLRRVIGMAVGEEDENGRWWVKVIIEKDRIIIANPLFEMQEEPRETPEQRRARIDRSLNGDDEELLRQIEEMEKSEGSR